MLSFISSIYSNFKKSMQRRHEYNILASLDDRQLQDMGLSRSDLDAVRKGTFKRRGPASI